MKSCSCIGKQLMAVSATKAGVLIQFLDIWYRLYSIPLLRDDICSFVKIIFVLLISQE
jgi:hypothetical protein